VIASIVLYCTGVLVLHGRADVRTLRPLVCLDTFQLTNHLRVRPIRSK
jgi:hypothetical protein